MMRRLAPALLPVALALIAWGCGGPAKPPARVVLVTIDTLRADRVGAFGATRKITPTLDALAAEGTVFESASATIPLTGPAHAGILTGRYPLATGFRNNGTAILPPEETLISETLRAGGFSTAAVVSCLVLSSHFGFSQGFDLYYDEDITSQIGRGLWFEERKADKTVDRTLRWVESEKEHPFFLWMHLFDPHHPYDPPGADLNSPVEPRYDDEIAFADKHLGRFFDALKAMDLWDDTLVIVSGDHGESLGDHEEAYHGIFTYESTMHIPFIVRLPGAPRGRRVADQVSLVDIAPTILQALGKPVPPEMQGVSLVDAVRGQGRVPARTAYLESIYGATSYGWAELRSVRNERWKYIDLPTPELYDLRADPKEEKNLALTDPARAAELRAELGRVQSDLAASQRGESSASSLDDEMRERLLSLGYIAGTESKLRKGEPRDPKGIVHVAEGISFANKLRSMKMNDGAERVLREVLREDPENKLALVSFARLLAATDRLDDALATMRKAIEIYPDSEEMYRSTGWMLIRNNRMQEAIDLFSQGLQQVPTKSSSMLYLYGFAHFRAQKWPESLKILGDSLSLNPGETMAWYLTGVCQEKLGKRQEAIASFTTYLNRTGDVKSLFDDPLLGGLRSDPGFDELVKPYL
ncbi:MAG: sulfatase-like hydrolase/transferase [Candidatus Polarisedimenticolia bacterium]